MVGYVRLISFFIPLFYLYDRWIVGYLCGMMYVMTDYRLH